jgi:hypothetical protein
MGEFFTMVQNLSRPDSGPVQTGPDLSPDRTGAVRLELAPESKSYRPEQAYKRCAMVPPDLLAKVEPRKNSKNSQRNHFLDDLELEGGKFAVTDAIRWHLKAVLKKGDQPAKHNDRKEWHVFKLQVPIPRDGHKDVGAEEEEDCSHKSTLRQIGCRPATDTLVNGAARLAGSV